MEGRALHLFLSLLDDKNERPESPQAVATENDFYNPLSLSLFQGRNDDTAIYRNKLEDEIHDTEKIRDRVKKVLLCSCLVQTDIECEEWVWMVRVKYELVVGALWIHFLVCLVTVPLLVCALAVGRSCL